MTTNAERDPERHEPHGKDPRHEAVVFHRFRRARWARLFRRSRCRTAEATNTRDVTVEEAPGAVRQRVLRDYHAVNLARARRGAEDLVRAGFNTGAVPYGYRAQRVRIAPAGRKPRWRTRLVIEPVEAATVKMIFTWRGIDGVTVGDIRRRLVAARYPAPLDPYTGGAGVWTNAVIGAILRNPKYLGRQVWGRHHHGRPTPASAWVWSPAWVHPPIVSGAEFEAANRRARPASSTAPDTNDRRAA
jgi:hypothetical protein